MNKRKHEFSVNINIDQCQKVLWPGRKNGEKILSQTSKSEYIEIKSGWKKAKLDIEQHFTFLGNGIMEA